jgi:hypothetical protein
LRSLPLATFAPLAAIDGVALVSLQKNDGAEQLGANAFPIHNFADLDGDEPFADTATDTNHEDDTFNLPEKELVRSFGFVGDTDGDEAGSKTGVTVHFNPAKVEVEE